MKKLLKLISYKDYLFSYLAVLAIIITAYIKLRPLLFEQSGLTRIFVSPFTLNVAFVFFLALYFWNKYAERWFKIKNKQTIRIVEIAGAFGIIVVFYIFMKLQKPV
jgi:hypothetical protein